MTSSIASERSGRGSGEEDTVQLFAFGLDVGKHKIHASLLKADRKHDKAFAAVLYDGLWWSTIEDNLWQARLRA